MKGPRLIIGVGFATGSSLLPVWGYENQVWIGWMT
jgi:hypothetical protein